MKAKETVKCDYDLCPHGRQIRVGEEITWNRKQAGTRYHVDCFVAAKGLSAYAPIKREDEGRAVAISFNSFDDTEIVIDEAPLEPEELKHYLYPLLAHYIGIRQHVYLHGAPGAGKSYVCGQIAKAMGLDFRFVSVNPQSPASKVEGYMDATRIFHEVGLFKCWRDGGVFLFDELDNCSASLLTTLNTMLAGESAEFPCGPVPKHKDFVFIGAGNTTGRGGDWQYPERRKIDEASIDRLAFIKWEYDEVLEVKFVENVRNGVAWAKWVQAVRRYCGNKANGIKGGIYTSPRGIKGGAADLYMIGKSFFSVEEIAERHVFKGADRDIVTRIVANCPLPRF